MEQNSSTGSYQSYFDGRMTFEAIEDLRSDWMEKLGAHSDMVIDLSDVECIDWAGMSLMLQIYEKAELDGKHVDFIGSNPAITDAMSVFCLLADLVVGKRNLLHWTLDEGAV